MTEEEIKSKYLGKYLEVYNPEFEEESHRQFYKVREIFDAHGPNEWDEEGNPVYYDEDYDGPPEFTFCSNVIYSIGNDGTIEVTKYDHYEEVETFTIPELEAYATILTEEEFYKNIDSINDALKEWIEYKPYWEK